MDQNKYFTVIDNTKEVLNLFILIFQAKTANDMTEEILSKIRNANTEKESIEAKLKGYEFMSESRGGTRSGASAYINTQGLTNQFKEEKVKSEWLYF